MVKMYKITRLHLPRDARLHHLTLSGAHRTPADQRHRHAHVKRHRVEGNARRGVKAQQGRPEVTTNCNT